MNSDRLNSILSLIAGLLFVWLITQLSSAYRVRWDLTEEKQYSVSDATKATLKSLEDEVFVEVFLEGELPPEFVRFQTAIREILDEFSIYGDVQFKFVNQDSYELEGKENRVLKFAYEPETITYQAIFDNEQEIQIIKK